MKEIVRTENMATVLLSFEPQKGANLTDCAVDAINLCLIHQVLVEFTHNDVVYRVSPGSLIDAVLRGDGDE